jgi:hypothetical protein
VLRGCLYDRIRSKRTIVRSKRLRQHPLVQEILCHYLLAVVSPYNCCSTAAHVVHWQHLCLSCNLNITKLHQLQVEIRKTTDNMSATFTDAEHHRSERHSPAPSPPSLIPTKLVFTETTHTAQEAGVPATVTVQSHKASWQDYLGYLGRYFRSTQAEDQRGAKVVTAHSNSKQGRPTCIKSTSKAINSIADTKRGEITKLRCELDEHFKILKDEFEEKTGRRWVPLRSYEDEEWEWVDDVVGNADWEEELL